MNREQSKNYFENKITTQPFTPASPAAPQLAVPVPDTTQSPAALADLAIMTTYERPFKIIAVITIIPVVFVILVSLGITIFRSIEKPTYSPLVLNLTLITAVTGLVYFWYFYGTFSYTMIWYIIIYAVLTVVQCVLIDMFVLVGLVPTPSTAPVTHHTIPAIPINGSNTTKHHLFYTSPVTTSHLDFT